MALITLFMWFKSLNFFRMHVETGYYIRMIECVFVDISWFLFVFIFTVFGFADAMYTISRANLMDEATAEKVGEETDKFVYFKSYPRSIIDSYLVALGDFGMPPDFDASPNRLISWFIFGIATMLNCIVMLNLLIAIVSETFAEVHGEKDQNSYLQKVNLISEN
jgi:hypothetical protein